MIAALLAKKAAERGLAPKPWVKTSPAPGSRVVMDYYDRAGLTPWLDKLGFNLVGYGCTTCIGNSGPLIPAVSAAVAEGDLSVCSVLSGNRNFEGRIHSETKLNYLASPPLVVAYALAVTDFAQVVSGVDVVLDPIGGDTQKRSYTVLRPGGWLVALHDRPAQEDSTPTTSTPRISLSSRAGRT